MEWYDLTFTYDSFDLLFTVSPKFWIAAKDYDPIWFMIPLKIGAKSRQLARILIFFDPGDTIFSLPACQMGKQFEILGP
jgi:hypothetical protein